MSGAGSGRRPTGLRPRLAVGTALLTAIVLTLFAGGAYWAAADGLRSAVDDRLRRNAEFMPDLVGFTGTPAAPRPVFLEPDDLQENDRGAEIFGPHGEPLGGVTAGPALTLGLTEAEAEIAQGIETEPILWTAEVDGSVIRMITVPIEGGGAIRISNDSTDIERGLDALRTRLALGTVATVVLVAFGAWWLAGRFVAPVAAVTDAAVALSHRQDLPSRIEVDRSDEVGRLAASFNALVEALAVAREQQRRLVADASHELRTPLTSLRTKIEFLQSTPGLEATTRRSVVDAAVVDLEGLTDLVAELVDLAADAGSNDEDPIELDLGALVEAEASRFARVSGRVVEVRVEPTRLTVRPRAVARALSNLLHNADKFSPPGQPIEVTQRAAVIEVRDHGPGIPAAERHRVFDRFYRSPAVSAIDGSGIGLAIVARVAELHRGEVWAGPADGGGALVGFSIAPTGSPGPPSMAARLPSVVAGS